MDLEASDIQFRKDLPVLTGIVRQIAESQQRHKEELQRPEFQRRREENEAFHREVDERFKAFIKMMEERLRNRRAGNGAS